MKTGRLRDLENISAIYLTNKNHMMRKNKNLPKAIRKKLNQSKGEVNSTNEHTVCIKIQIKFNTNILKYKT